MRKLFLIGIAFVAILYAAPAALKFMEERELPALSSHSPENAIINAQNASTENGVDKNISNDTTISVQIDGKATEIPLESYVAGVTAAEISEHFPIEAIKAQAVAARTYAIYKMQRGKPTAHPDADVCDDYHHCAAYRDITATVSTGENFSNVQKAVKETAGQIITYDENPIAAVFHCASGPKTESSKNVWGGEDVPYLQSVVSPGGSACDSYEASVEISAEDFRKKVAETFPTADVSGNPSSWFKASIRSDAGGIETVNLGGITVTGTAIRSLFRLNSTNFTITTTDTNLTFHTIGYGHGVGLSQYGAKYMAEQGSNYEDILSHYYINTILSNV